MPSNKDQSRIAEFLHHSLMMNKDRIMETGRILNLTLEIIFLLTGEDFVLTKKRDDPAKGNNSCLPAQSPITEPPSYSLAHEETTDKKTLEQDKAAGEKVPVRCEDVAVFFSVEEWEYLEGHKEHYKDMVMATCQPPVSAGCDRVSPERTSEDERLLGPSHPQEPVLGNVRHHPVAGGGSATHPSDPCDTPLYSPGCIEEEDRTVTQEYQAEPGGVIYQQQCKEEDVPAEISPGAEAGVELDAGDHRGLQEFLPETSAGPHASSHYPEKTHQCSECQQCFPNHSTLVTHQQTHSASNLYRCSICGVHFSSKFALTAHQRCHTEDKVFLCSYCGKSFHQRSRLLYHKRTHTGEKPFSCQECGRRFAWRSTLTKHQRIHSGENLFSCTECSKCFVQKADFVKHQRTHTGERPFVCSQCGRCFSDSSNFCRHQRVHTGLSE